jgi:hypothetical protein
MLDSGVSANMISLKVMRKLGLEITRPYKNVCGIESRAIPTHGVIDNVKVFLAQYPNIALLMEILVVDVSNVWGVLLSRNFDATLGGTLQMDLTGLNMPMDNGTYNHLQNMTMKKDHL